MKMGIEERKKVGKKPTKKVVIIVAVILALCLVAVIIFKSCGSSMSYDDYDLSEYLKVGDYKGLEVAPYTVSVTEADIDAQIQTALEAATTTKDLDKGAAIADGDTVNIDYTGKVDGKKFDNGSAKGSSLVIGSGTFIDGFESGLIGKTVGEKLKLNLTFPDDYNEESLQGKDVVFTVTVNSATRQEVPEYSLDFVQNTTDYKTLEEYEAAVGKQLTKDKEAEAINTQKTTLWSAALDNTKVKKYPDREVEHYIEFNSQQMDDMAKSYGMSREDLLASYEFGDEEAFAAVNEDGSKLRVKQEMLIEYIADKEGLEYTDKERKALIADFEQQGYDEDAVKTQTGRTMDEYIHIELLYQKVLDFLLENANITGEATTAAAE